MLEHLSKTQTKKLCLSLCSKIGATNIISKLYLTVISIYHTVLSSISISKVSTNVSTNVSTKVSTKVSTNVSTNVSTSTKLQHLIAQSHSLSNVDSNSLKSHLQISLSSASLTLHILITSRSFLFTNNFCCVII